MLLIDFLERGRGREERDRDRYRDRDRDRGGEEEKEKHQFVVPLIHWLILICALTGDQTCNPGVLGQHS